MGLLGDLYSTIDSKKRQLRGLLSDPLETIYQGVRNIGNDWNGLLDTQAQAYPFIPRTQDQQARIQAMARTPEQARKELADQGANMGIAAATVWHGSPHKFDKFDSSKIGTGEGAQAYGHGLYFAESPDVAKGYKETLTNRWDKVFLKGQPIEDQMSDVAMALRDYNQKGGNFSQWKKQTAERMQGAAMNGPGAGRPDRAKELLDASNIIRNLTKADIQNTGSLYKVDLPDEHIAKMLDWDKPLSQQAPEVKNAISALKNANPDGYAKLVDMQMGGPLMDQATGRDLYRSIGHDPFASSGIPGIRYLDGGSRGAGTGTSNYVVFPGNEDILKILERNGQPLGLLD